MTDEPTPNPRPDKPNATPAPLDLEPADHAASVVATPKPKIDLVALRARVLATLRERHAINGQMAALLIGAGVAALLVIGFLFCLAMVILGRLLFDNPLGFNAWFGIYLLILVGVFIWQERRTRYGFFTFAAVDVDLRRDPDNAGEYLINRSQAHARTLVEVLLWGPRAIIAAVRSLLGKPQPGLELILPEAADTLTLMLSLDGGVKIKALVGPDEDPMLLMPVLKWLDAHDYIGISSKGDRVWVSSPAKKLFPIG